jgi:hypothetical protein
LAERFHIHNHEVEPGVFELSLERQEGKRHLLGTRWETVAVLARRRYRAKDMFGLAEYRAALTQAARHAAAGHYGCYVDTKRHRGGKVEVELVSRQIKDAKLHGPTASTTSARPPWRRARSSTTWRWRTQPSASARRPSWRRSCAGRRGPRSPRFESAL